MEPIAAESVMVIVLCADGKLRQSPLTIKQSCKVRRVVAHLHGGAMRINPEEILVMSETDALEAFGRLTGKLPFFERWKRRFIRLGVSAGILPAVATVPAAPQVVSEPEQEVAKCD